jgi:hypothetical protein
LSYLCQDEIWSSDINGTILYAYSIGFGLKPDRWLKRKQLKSTESAMPGSTPMLGAASATKRTLLAASFFGFVAKI